MQTQYKTEQDYVNEQGPLTLQLDATEDDINKALYLVDELEWYGAVTKQTYYVLWNRIRERDINYMDIKKTTMSKVYQSVYTHYFNAETFLKDVKDYIRHYPRSKGQGTRLFTDDYILSTAIFNDTTGELNDFVSKIDSFIGEYKPDNLLEVQFKNQYKKLYD